MSEFRKHRLVSKLLDIYGLASSPQKYLQILVGTENSGGRGAELDVSEIARAAAQSADPTLFTDIARSLSISHAEELANTLRLVRLLPHKSPKAPSEASLVNTPKNFAAGYPRLETVSYPDDLIPRHENSEDEELDQLVERLSRVQHRIGIYDFHKEIPAESIEGQPEFLVLQTFRNEVEWRAGQYALPLQEILIVEDLLYLLLGLSGRYFGRDSDREWTLLVDDSLSGTILEMVRPVLRLALCASYLGKFAEEKVAFVDGRVLQSLASAISELLHELHQVVVLLEKKFTAGILGLQQFCFHLLPYSRNLQVVTHLVAAINKTNLRGGAILKLLEAKADEYTGDRAVRNLIESLLEKAAEPLLGLLRNWLRDGGIDDSCEEFIIRTRDHRDAPLVGPEASSPTSKYILIAANMPNLLQPLQNRILQVGAYHNILQSYATETEPYEGTAAAGTNELHYDQRRISRLVDACLASVNERMLRVLFDKDRLQNSLLLCKRQYFIGRCDVLYSFLDLAREELERTSAVASLDAVRGHWELALRALPTEDYERVDCQFAAFSLPDQLLRIIGANPESRSNTNAPNKVIDLFMLKTSFEFPDNLVFTEENMSKYDLIFRLLFRLANLERELGQPARLAKAIPPASLKLFHLLRHQMLHFTKNLHQYLVFDVLEPNWNRLQSSFIQASGIEEIMQVHSQYIDSCLRQAMLTNAKLVQLVAALLSQCGRFVLLIAERGRERSEAADLQSKLTSMQASFTKYMRILLEALQYYSARDCDYHLGSLFSRLDFNTFYYSTAFGSQEHLSNAERRASHNGSSGGLVSYQ